MIDHVSQPVVQTGEDAPVLDRSDVPLRLSMRGKLALSVLVGSFPLAVVAVYFAWDAPARWWVVAGGLLAMGAGCAVVGHASH